MKVADYLSVTIDCQPAFLEILIAELSELDYDSMMEIENGLEAYIKPAVYDESSLKWLQEKYPEAKISYSVEEVVERNWNEEWEKNYDPIEVENKIRVRASFHPADPNFEYEILINPRMSFGTGHHATTYLMLKNQLEIDHKNKRVLDAGCGTAILAIMAEKLGAKEVIAYDNNSWSTENSPENLQLNHCEKVTVMEGTIDSLDLPGKFDIILANINKNVLLEEMPLYVEKLASKGIIVFSGFYEKDEKDLITSAEAQGLILSTKHTRNDWSSVVFIKMGE